MIRLLLQLLLGNDAVQKMSAQAANKASSVASDAAEKIKEARAPYKVNPSGTLLPAWMRRTVIGIVVILALFFAVVSIGANLGTDILWFNQLGFLNVLKVQYLAPLCVFLVGFVIAAVCSMISLTLVYRLRSNYQLSKLQTTQLDELKSKFAKRHILWFLLISAVIGAFYGFFVADSTYDILLMSGSTPFNQTDPIFGLDVSFYVFILPGLEAIIGSLVGLFVLMIITAFIAGSMFGQTSTTTQMRKLGKTTLLHVARPLRVQLSIYAVLLSFCVAALVYLRRFDLLTSISDRMTGATWTDVNVTIPALQICAGLCVLIGLLFIWTAISGNVKIPLISIGSTAVLAFIIVGIVPVLMQNFKVTPNAQELEKEYIQNNIKATTAAYGLDKVEVESYNATTDTKAGQLQNDVESTSQIRLLDPQILAPTFRQLQQNKQYYGFQDTLSVDKYTIDGKSHDTVISARELDLTGSDQRNWINDHTVFTHGFGVVAAYGNKITVDGRPQFYEKDIPNSGDLTKSEEYEPRLYFSKNAPTYSIVGAPEGKAWEFDYPEATENVTFKGNGGPQLSNAFVKLLYAVRFKDYQLFFTDRVNDSSQILYNRDPEERVKEVAPYLELDGRVYPAVVDGHVKWILDGYTTTDRYPYSKMIDIGQATKDTITETSKSVSALDSRAANYIRNSVKITVDAYDGSVSLYSWDDSDPILKAWTKIYGQELHPVSEISGDLMSHIRYPENLFKVQRALLANYHVTDAGAFFSGSDFWQVPTDPTNSGTVTAAKTGTKESGVKQPPYYLTLQMPGNKQPVFSLTSTFIPGGGAKREILTGFLSADSDAGSQPGVIGPNYGKLHLLELPKNTTVPGPGQAQNNFNANADVSKELNLLSGTSSSIIRGNLLTLPIGGGLVYIQPVYVQSTGTTTFPLLKKVLVAFGDKVGFADTLEAALNQVFGGNSGVANTSTVAIDGSAAQHTDAAGQTNSTDPSSNATTPQPNPTQSDSTTSPVTKEQLEQLKQALDQAKKALDDATKVIGN
ncbi:MAG: UPF0182 family protein [Candidatus Ancillula sp.]|jgi:uncharacterized membrane protein (UPF0182 family)|nr:UPF0182 family protein [Candidatus Ancillula sp.]